MWYFRRTFTSRILLSLFHDMKSTFLRSFFSWNLSFLTIVHNTRRVSSTVLHVRGTKITSSSSPCDPMQSQESMLYLVGLGLGDAKDITVKGLEIVKRADYVFLEAYTSILCVGQEVLVCKVHKNALWLTWTWPKEQSKLMLKDAYFNGLLHLKSVPPGRGLTFSSYSLRLAKIAFTPEDFRKIWVYPWRTGSYPWRIWVNPWRILWKLRPHPQRIPYIFTLPLKKSPIFITYPWRIPWFLNRGVGGCRY